jgi:dihydrofolate synthase/folylpolyglutamate synthase
MRFRTARQAEDYLLGFVNYEALARYQRTARTHDLRRFAARLADMGWDPHSVPAVHVGGTNAKGTVAHLIERILRAGGERTGLYTSPHLHTMRERVRVNGRSISARGFAEAVSIISEHFSAEPAAGFRTTFEHLTALALLHFQNERVSRAVVEVGLGGRLDATNVLPPGPVVLTPISIDHRAVLGRTVGRIAADKAFILKRGGHAFVMPQPPTALSAIRSRLVGEGMSATMVREAVQVVLERADTDGGVFAVRGRENYGRIATRLLGAHQTDNIAAAVAVAEALLPRPVAKRAVARGLRDACVPGRLEVVRIGGRHVLFDGGHNPGAARAVAAAVRLHFPGARVGMLVGMAIDKDHRAFFKALTGLPQVLVFTRAAGVRSAPPERLAQRSGRVGRCTETVLEGLDRALTLKVDVLLVAGSFLVAAEARQALGLGPE